MAEKVGAIYFDLDLNDSKFNKGIDTAGAKADSFGSKISGASVQLAALGAAAGIALYQIKDAINQAVDAAVKQQNALMGLTSISAAFGQDTQAATEAAKSLAADGLMPIGDAAASLKNLLAAGFNLPQAVTLMKRFKDTAAFGRQGALDFGQAIVGATEGIKNGNCLTSDTPVLLSTGEEVNIGDLYNRDDSFSVYSLYADGSIKHTSVSHVIDNGIKPVYRLVLNDGKTIRATGNHRFLTTNGFKILDDLECSDEILTIDRVDDQNDINSWFGKQNAHKGIIDGKAFNSMSLEAGIPFNSNEAEHLNDSENASTQRVDSSGIGIGQQSNADLYGSDRIDSSVYSLRKSKVKSIELDRFERVYDLSVPETRNFVAAGMVVHNSILVDNAGVTKNLSVMLEEAGYSSQDLMKASSDAGVRQAIFNGILKESNPMLGDAAKLSESFGGAAARTDTKITNLKVAIGEALQPVLSSLMDILTPIIDNFIKFAKENPQLVATLAIVGVSLLVIATILGVLGTIIGGIISILPIVGAMFAAVFSPVGLIIMAIIAVVALLAWFIISNFENIKNFCITVWNAISATVMTVISSIINWFMGIIIAVITVWNAIRDGFNAGAAFIGSIIQGVVNWIGDRINDIVNFFRAIGGNIGSALSNIWGKITGAFSGAFNWIGDRINDVVNFFKDLPQKIINGLGELWKVGESIINGIVDGLKPENVINKIKEICSGALDAVKNFFGIHSPSRLMAEMGNMIMAGLGNGISDQASKVIKTAAGVSQQLYSSMSGSARADYMMSGSINALDSASSYGSNNTPIAQSSPVNITLKQDGILARSSSEMRDIFNEGISLVNQQRRAQGRAEI